MFIIKKNCVESCRRLFIGLAVCFGVALASPAISGQERGADDLAMRLAKLERRIEEERKKGHIPGVAIAVIKDDTVVFAKGFGCSDLETKQLVTPGTLFAIGSTTKAFTATLVGMLADDSKMSWDDPVDKQIPADSTLRSPRKVILGFLMLVGKIAGIGQPRFGKNNRRQSMRLSLTQEIPIDFRPDHVTS